MVQPFLSNHVQAVVSALLLLGLTALYLARFASRLRWLVLLLAAMLLDQGTKALLQWRLPGEALYHPYDYLGGWFHIEYLQNDSLGFGSGFPLLLLTTLTLVLLLAVLYQRLAKARYRMSTLMEVGLALVAAGVLGIVLDRMRLGYVVDFLEFGPDPSYVYNVADVCALVGGLIVLLRVREMVGRRRPAAEAPRLQARPAPTVSVLLISVALLQLCWWQSPAKLPPLHAAVARGDVAAAARLLKRGVEVNQRDQHGMTALHWAAATGHADVAALLLLAGADAQARADDGKTPREVARDEAVRRLLAAPPPAPSR